jgi:hypothetical protein
VRRPVGVLDVRRRVAREARLRGGVRLRGVPRPVAGQADRRPARAARAEVVLRAAAGGSQTAAKRRPARDLLDRRAVGTSSRAGQSPMLTHRALVLAGGVLAGQQGLPIQRQSPAPPSVAAEVAAGTAAEVASRAMPGEPGRRDLHVMAARQAVARRAAGRRAPGRMAGGATIGALGGRERKRPS